MSKIIDILPFLIGHADYVPTALCVIRELRKDHGVVCIPDNYREKPFLNKLEKEDLFERANWLLEKVLMSPQKLIDSMPSIIGRQYQGQWAIYACAMTAVALCNIVRIYPEAKEKYLDKVPLLIELLMSDEIKYYDTIQWREDALKTLDGNESHMTYLSLLAWVISTYLLSGGDNIYLALYKSFVEHLPDVWS